MPTIAKSIDLANLTARASKASATIAKKFDLNPEKGIFLDPTTVIGRRLREIAGRDLAELHEASIAITKRASTDTGPALTPVTYLQGDDILIGFILREPIEVATFNVGP